MKKLLMGVLFLAALAGTTAMAQDRDDSGWRARGHDLRHDYRDRRQDWRDIHRDKHSIAYDRAELRHDYRVGDYAAARRERAEILAKQRGLRHDYRDLRRDNRDIYRDRHGWGWR
jgi:hypothetical protein